MFMDVKSISGGLSEKSSTPEPPTCCGSRAPWARRLAAKAWPACCVRCCIRPPKPPPSRMSPQPGCCRRVFGRLACCGRRKDRDVEMGMKEEPAASLLPKKQSFCSRLRRALSCARCCARLCSCACCTCTCCACCARCSPCCRKLCRGGAVADVNPNPLEDRRKSQPANLRSKRPSRSMPGTNEVMPDEEGPVVRKLDPALLDQNSMIQAAIPVLPLHLAWFCLICNVLVPGLGTIASGAFCLCVGMPRITVEDRPENRLTTFILDLVVGIGQAFTVIFCLVGWGWSIWWGTIMVKLARKQRRLLLKKAEELAKPAARKGKDKKAIKK